MVVPVTPEVCCFHPSVIQEASGDPISLVNELSSLWCSVPSAGDTHPLSFPVHLGVRWESTECSQRPLCLSREQGGDGLATCWDALGRGRSCLNVGRRAPGFIFHALFLKFIYLFIGCAESSLQAFSSRSTWAQLPCSFMQDFHHLSLSFCYNAQNSVEIVILGKQNINDLQMNLLRKSCCESVWKVDDWVCICYGERKGKNI